MDDRIRIYAFDWLEKQTKIYGEVLPREILERGFLFNDEKITLVGRKGIWKPKFMDFPISITTTPESQYSDSISTEGFLKYKYRGENINQSDNVGVRSMIVLQKPLIYFHGITKGRYLASWPVYIIGDNKSNLEFTVAVDDVKTIGTDLEQVAEDPTLYRRSYITSNFKVRLHQQSFRERVLRAYRNQCALCKIKHAELLDAAHIIGDKDGLGDPIIQNGLSLCKIHHAAFDNHFIGINPDFIIKVKTDLLNETDGPMLRYGIQSLNNTKIILPAQKNNWPDKERLEIRFNKFLNAG